MSLLRSLTARSYRQLSRTTITQTRHIASSSTKSASPSEPSPKQQRFPTTPSCPSSSCTCASMPAFPAGFEIDHDKPLAGTVASYAEQVLICTGKDDWASNIVDEVDDGGNGGGKIGNLAKGIKGLVGRGGSFVDPYHNILVTNASFPSSPPLTSTSTPATSAYLLPSFRYIPSIPSTPTGIRALTKGLLLPQKLHPMHDGLNASQKARLQRDETQATGLGDVRAMGRKEVLVLICGHGGRDVRCGVLGPLLRSEFEKSLQRLVPSIASGEEGKGEGAKVGLISHIGGHKFAGNVIIYIPPGYVMADGEVNPLAGMGIWYGRVEPRHVDGIVRETVMAGRVIEELFRGGIRQGGEALKL